MVPDLWHYWNMAVNHKQETTQFRVRVAEGGRLVIPAPFREGLGIKEGDVLLLTWDEGGLRLTTMEQTLHEVQGFFRGLAEPGGNVVGELLRERQQEAGNE